MEKGSSLMLVLLTFKTFFSTVAFVAFCPTEILNLHCIKIIKNPCNICYILVLDRLTLPRKVSYADHVAENKSTPIWGVFLFGGHG